MISYNQTYLSTQEIFEKISYFSGTDILGMVFFLAFILWFIFLINYVIPIIFISRKYVSDERKKSKRKNLIRKIAMQKQIDEEIELEFKKENLKKATL